MNAAQKAELVASLDLQEPVAVLTRYERAGKSRSIRGHLTMMSVLGAIASLRDPELTRAAMESPQFVEKRIYAQSRDAEALADMSRTAAVEAMRHADVVMLEMAKGRFKEERSFDSEFDFARRFADQPPAIRALAQQADANPYAEVRACAAWALAANTRFLGGGVEDSSAGSKKTAQLAERLGVLRSSAAKAMLDVACDFGSSNLVRAATELGAKPSAQNALTAFREGSPGLARALLAACETPSSEDLLKIAKDSAYTLMNLSETLDPAGKVPEEHQWSLTAFDAIKADVGPCLSAFLANPAVHESILGEAQRELLAVSMALCHHFSDPVAWVAEQRIRYPEPHPMELCALAKAGKWGLLKGRLKDAKGAALGPAWAASLQRHLAQASEERGSSNRIVDEVDKVARVDRLEGRWFFKLALAAREAGVAGGAGGDPVMGLLQSGFSREELEKAVALVSAKVLGKTAKLGAKPPGKGPLRV